MNLFSNEFYQHNNLLPKDGNVVYLGKIFSVQIANHFFSSLMNNIEWKNDEAIILGKHIITKRKVAWYGNTSFNYTYSKITKQALVWTKELLELKEIVEQKTTETYNSCLLNLYHNGDEGMAWHSDAEKALKENGVVSN